MRKKTIKTEIVEKHVLVPKHTKCSQKEVKEILDKFQCSLRDLPKIYSSDPAISGKEYESGTVIKIERKSSTAGISYYYRVVIDA